MKEKRKTNEKRKGKQKKHLSIGKSKAHTQKKGRAALCNKTNIDDDDDKTRAAKKKQGNGKLYGFISLNLCTHTRTKLNAFHVLFVFFNIDMLLLLRARASGVRPLLAFFLFRGVCAFAPTHIREEELKSYHPIINALRLVYFHSYVLV
jgi:hypothetical protein